MTQYIDTRQVGGMWAVTEIGDDGLSCTIWITGPDDTNVGAHVDYDPDCSSCWLGHAHSPNLHERNVTRAKETLAAYQATRKQPLYVSLHDGHA